MSPRTGTGFDGRGGGRRSVEKAHPVEGWWVLNSRILFIPYEQQADKPSAGSDASLSQAVLQSIGRGQLGLEDGSLQIRNQPGKTKMDPFRTAIVLSSSCGVEGWWVLNSRILFIPSEQQADKPSAGSDASLSQAVLQSIGRGQLGLEDGSPQIRNQPGKTKMDPFRTAIVLSSSCGGESRHHLEGHSRSRN
ncbi:unnamed protein product [Boreogadus saida]